MIGFEQKFGELHISYFNQNGNIQLEKIKIPDQEMYNWEECSESDPNKDPIKTSQFGNPVKKKIVKYLNKYRQKEFFLSNDDLLRRVFQKNNPKKWYIDIETTSHHGFPDWRNPIEELLCYVLCDDTNIVHIMGLKNWSSVEQEKMFNQIQSYFDDDSNYRQGYQKFNIKFKFKYHYFVNEAQLIQHYYYKVWPQLPMVLGWNILGFDFPYFNARAKVKGVDIAAASPTKSITEQYIKDRYDDTKNIKLELPSHRCVLDYMRIYEKWDTSQKFKTSMALDQVAYDAIGLRKLSYNGTIQEFYDNDPIGFMAYCAIDTILVRLLDDKLGTLKSAMQLARRSFVPFYENEYASTMLESCFIKKQLSKNKVVVSPKHGNEDTYPGAYVEEPKPGFFKNVAIADFASQYPSIMMYGNIGVDTLLGKMNESDKTTFLNKQGRSIPIDSTKHIVLQSGFVYNKEEDGITRLVIGDFFSDRMGFKKMGSDTTSEIDLLKKYLKEGNFSIIENSKFIDIEKLKVFDEIKIKEEIERLTLIKIEAKNDDSSTKILLNSIYGVLGYINFPWYQRDVAFSVTKESQELIKFSIREYNRYFKEVWHTSELDAFRKEMNITEFSEIKEDVVNYADTDSIFMVLDVVISRTDFKGEAQIFCRRLYDSHLEKWMKDRFIEHLNSMNSILNKPNGDFALIMELEQVCHSVLWTKKKRYIKEVAYANSTAYKRFEELQVKGMEMNKSSTPKFIRNILMQNVVRYIIEHDAKFNMTDFIKEITKIRSEFYTINPEDISATERIGNYSKFILNHKEEVLVGPNCKVHTKGAAHFNNLILKNKLDDKISLIGTGQKVSYYYVDQQKCPNMEVFSYPVGNLPMEIAPPIDRIKQFEFLFLSPLNAILEAIGKEALKPSLINIPKLSW